MGLPALAESAVHLLGLQHGIVVDGGERFVLSADVPVGSYKPYQYAVPGGSRFVLELTAASSRLEPRYSFGGPLVDAVQVTPVVDGGTRSTRVMFELRTEVDYSIDVKGAQIVLEFRLRSAGGLGAPPELASREPRLTASAARVRDESAVPIEEYRIGAGDVLQITVFDHDDLTGNFHVEADGALQFPLVGRIAAAGRTTGELQSELRAVLDRDYLVSPQVAVNVEEYKSQAVDVVGAVRNAGRYFLKGATRLQDILAMAGGVANDAGEEIDVTRGGGDGRLIRVPRSELYDGRRPELNVVLKAGDVVEVKTREGISVLGEVTRPGSYDWKPSLTVLQAVALAGGLTVWAKEEAQILRGQRRIEVSLSDIRRGKTKDVQLEPGDHVSVPRRLL